MARALVTTPKFVVFDEAVSALDVSIQAQILNLIKELQSEIRFASLFISHDLAAVRYVAHEIAVMNQGEIVALAPAKSFYAPIPSPGVKSTNEGAGLDALILATLVAERNVSPAIMAQDTFGGASWTDG